LPQTRITLRTTREEEGEIIVAELMSEETMALLNNSTDSLGVQEYTNVEWVNNRTWQQVKRSSRSQSGN